MPDPEDAGPRAADPDLTRPDPADATPDASLPPSGFHPFLDATRFNSDVDWGRFQVPTLEVVYVGQLGFRRNGGWWHQLPPVDVIAERVRRLPDADIYCLDVEHWPVVNDDPEARERNIDRLLRILAIFRSERPTAKLGYWGLFPRYTYFAAHRWPQLAHPDSFAKQRTLNRAASRLIDAVDVLFPSLYAVENGVGDPPSAAVWESRARAILEEARRSGKPVIPFLWTAKDWSESFWRLQLDVSAEGSDAVAIWGHEGWSETDRWYRVLQERLEHDVVQVSFD